MGWIPQSDVNWTVGLDGRYTMRLTFGSWADLNNLVEALVPNKKRLTALRASPQLSQREG